MNIPAEPLKPSGQPAGQAKQDKETDSKASEQQAKVPPELSGSAAEAVSFKAQAEASQEVQDSP